MDTHDLLPDFFQKANFIETVNGKYFPDYHVWVWNNLLSLVDRGIYTPDQLKDLTTIAAGIGKLYLAQIKKGFWPKEISIDKIKEEYAKDSGIASHYGTVVYENGEYKSLGYISAFPEETHDLIDELEKVMSKKSLPQENLEYFELVLESLKLKEINTRKPAEFSSLDEYLASYRGKTLLITQPTEDYMDEIAGKYPNVVFDKNDNPWKYSFEFELHVENSLLNKSLMDDFRAKIFQTYPGVFQSSDNLMFVDNCIMASLSSNEPNRGQSLPNDMEIREKHGKQIIMFANNVDYRAKNHYWNLFEKVVENNITSQNKFALGTQFFVLSHELSHNVCKFAVVWLEEMKASVLGLNIFQKAKKELAAEGISYVDVFSPIIAECIEIYARRNDTFAGHYYIGDNMLFNCLVKHEGVQIQSNGKIRIDYEKCILAIENLSDEIIELQSHISKSDADDRVEQFRNKWFSERVYEKITI